MQLDASRPTAEWFDPPSYGQIEKTYEMHEFSGKSPYELLEHLYSLTENQGSLIPADFELAFPDAITFKKPRQRYVEIETTLDDSREGILDSLYGITYESNRLGYQWGSFNYYNRVPFLSCIEGLEFFVLSFGKAAGELNERTGIVFNREKKPRTYANEFIWELPSRHRVGNYHVTKIRPLPTRNSKSRWPDIGAEHSCEDAVYKFGRIRYVCDHIAAAILAAEHFSSLDNPFTASPIIIPKKPLVEFDDILRYRVIRESDEKKRRNLNEAERGLIIGWLIAYHASRKEIDHLFSRKLNLEDVNDVIKFI